jgi:hypothetical protein
MHSSSFFSRANAGEKWTSRNPGLRDGRKAEGVVFLQEIRSTLSSLVVLVANVPLLDSTNLRRKKIFCF